MVKNMFVYFLRRFISLIPMVLVLSFLIYLGLELTPGDAVSFMVPPDQIANLKPEDLEKMRDSLGLNDPFFVRYLNWLS